MLLVRLRSIGDTVLSTPSLFALRRFLPNAQIDILVEDWVAPVLDSHPYADNVVVLERGGLRARSRTAWQLRSTGYDVVYNLHGGTTADFSNTSERRATSRWFENLSIRATAQSPGAVAIAAVGTTEGLTPSNNNSRCSDGPEFPSLIVREPIWR